MRAGKPKQDYVELEEFNEPSTYRGSVRLQMLIAFIAAVGGFHPILRADEYRLGSHCTAFFPSVDMR